VRYVEEHPGEIADQIAKGVGKQAKRVREALEVVRASGRLWKSSGRRDDGGRAYRKGGFYPSAHAAKQEELGRPAGGTITDDHQHPGPSRPESSQAAPLRGAPDGEDAPQPTATDTSPTTS
jgi:hypothetical protein